MNTTKLMESPRVMPDLHMGEQFSVDEFMQYVAQGAYNQEDGSGYWGNEHYYDQEAYVFARWGVTHKPSWATHVAWFSK